MIDVATVKELAVHHGVQPVVLEKVLRLAELLDAFNLHVFLKDRLALKGGTALNLFFGIPKRLSVDLDFNYVGAVEREEMLRERPSVERAIAAVAAELRYSVQSSAGGHAGRTWFLNYENHEKRPDRIEVDVVFTNRVPLLPLQRRAPWAPDLGQNRTSLLCSTEELVAGKLRALVDRVAARDVFDATWVTSLVAGSQARLFKRLFVFFCGTLERPLPTYSVARLRTLTERDVEVKLRPMLLGQPEVTCEDLVGAAMRAMGPLLDLDEPEREFSNLINRGTFQPELILGDWPEVLEPLKLHPALLWKADNATRPGSSR